MNKNGTTQKPRFYQRLSIFLGVAVLLLGVAVITQSFIRDTEPVAEEPSDVQDPTPEAEQNTDSPIVRRIDNDPMALGSLDAPVVLTIWTDLRCPFCALFERETLPILIEEYVQTGQVRIEINDVIFFGEQSENAAVAARAAGIQGKFFEYLSAVYAAAPADEHPDLPNETLITFAEEVAVADIDQFTTDLEHPALHTAVQQSTLYAQQLGIDSVPFFVAGDTALTGAHPIDTFRNFLDTALAERLNSEHATNGG